MGLEEELGSALQIEHRTSTEVDFFGKSEIDFNLLTLEIHSRFEFKIEVDSGNIKIGSINGTKVETLK